MKNHSFPCLTLTVALLASGAAQLCAADWSSLHGNNRSTPDAPSARQAAHPVQPPVSHQDVRAVEHVEAYPTVMAHTPAIEADRRRMDVAQDRRQSYFWSDYHAGMRIDQLPDGYRHFRIHYQDYFYFDGVYYYPGSTGYVVCAPPLEAEIPELPPGVEVIQVGDIIYYYAAGAYYVQRADGSFVVVSAPLGVTVSLLPPDANSVVVNGVGYFLADGIYYEPVMQAGVIAYLTIPSP